MVTLSGKRCSVKSGPCREPFFKKIFSMARATHNRHQRNVWLMHWTFYVCQGPLGYRWTWQADCCSSGKKARLRFSSGLLPLGSQWYLSLFIPSIPSSQCTYTPACHRSLMMCYSVYCRHSLLVLQMLYRTDLCSWLWSCFSWQTLWGQTSCLIHLCSQDNDWNIGEASYRLIQHINE